MSLRLELTDGFPGMATDQRRKDCAGHVFAQELDGTVGEEDQHASFVLGIESAGISKGICRIEGAGIGTVDGAGAAISGAIVETPRERPAPVEGIGPCPAADDGLNDGLGVCERDTVTSCAVQRVAIDHFPGDDGL